MRPGSMQFAGYSLLWSGSGGGSRSGVVTLREKQITGALVGGLIMVAMLLAMTAAPGTALDPAFDIALALQDEATPTADPLEVPELPQNPTQVDIGRVSYYYNCMPCHGDHGQGLTDEWRATWVEDHQNCWARGCHSGRAGDEGFPLPDRIPALAGVPEALDRFASPESLYEYLKQNHPPQNPGALPEEEYRALTAFLLALNGQGNMESRVGARSRHPASWQLLAVAALGTLAVWTVWFWFGRLRQK